MADQPAEKRYTVKAVAKALGMTTAAVRLYVRLGFFLRPIRSYDNSRGGFWLEDDVEDMRKRHLKMHRYRIPKVLRAEMEKLTQKKKPRGQP